MQILILLGLVIIGASVALIYMQKKPDDKEKNFINNVFTKIDDAANKKFGTGEEPEEATEKYEKSADGKVVYIFKNKDGETSAEEVAADDVADEGSDDDEAGNDVPNPKIVDIGRTKEDEYKDAEIVTDAKFTDEPKSANESDNEPDGGDSDSEE